MSARKWATACLTLILSSGAYALELPGVTAAYHSAELALAVSGKVQNVLVREGDQVKKGQALIQLFNRAEALDAERKKLLWKSRDEVDAAIKKADVLERILNSTELLHDRGAVSTDELDQKRLDFMTAEVTKAQLLVREKVEKIDYELARTALNYRTLTAPFSGVVTRLVKENGESIEAYQPVLKLVDLSRGYFNANVEPNVALKLTLGQEVLIRAGNGQELTGKVVFISPEIEPASGLMQIKAEYVNPDGVIPPGMSASLIL